MIIRYEYWNPRKARAKRKCHVCSSLIVKGEAFVEVQAGAKNTPSYGRKQFHKAVVKQNICLRCASLGVRPPDSRLSQKLEKDTNNLLSRLIKERS